MFNVLYDRYGTFVVAGIAISLVFGCYYWWQHRKRQSSELRKIIDLDLDEAPVPSRLVERRENDEILGNSTN